MPRSRAILAQKVLLAQKLATRHSIFEHQINVVGAHQDPALQEPRVMITHPTTFTKPTPVGSADHE